MSWDMLWNLKTGMVLLVVIACLGMFWRLRAAKRYGRIAKRCERKELERDRYLKQWKKQVEDLLQTRRGTANLSVFLRKSLRRYRVRGITLHGWNQMASMAVGMNLLAGFILAFLAWYEDQTWRIIAFYGMAGMVLAGIGILFGILMDNPHREDQTFLCLQNYFENELFTEPLREKGDVTSRTYLESREKIREPAAAPVYLIRPEEEEVVEEVFREYFT